MKICGLWSIFALLLEFCLIHVSRCELLTLSVHSSAITVVPYFNIIILLIQVFYKNAQVKI